MARDIPPNVLHYPSCLHPQDTGLVSCGQRQSSHCRRAARKRESTFPSPGRVLKRATTLIEQVQATRATGQPFGLFAEHTCTRARPESLQGNSCEYDTLPGLESGSTHYETAPTHGFAPRACCPSKTFETLSDTQTQRATRRRGDAKVEHPCVDSVNDSPGPKHHPC